MWLRLSTVLALFSLSVGCDQDIGGVSGDGGINYNMSMTVIPDPANLDLVVGGPPASQSFMAIAHFPGGDQDVTYRSSWYIEDTGMGSMPNNTFTSVTDRGGSTLVHATYSPPGQPQTMLMGEAQLNVKIHALKGNCGAMACPPFPGDGAPMCTQAGASPTLVYPPDKVVLPPNMNVISVHFLPGAGNDIWEIDFQNNATDVRVVTLCSPITDTRGYATGGCEYKLDTSVWNYIAHTNRGADPVNITVRGAPMNGSCVDHSDSRIMSFTQEDIHGGIYYWQSLVQNGMPAGTTGGIYRHDFGDVMSTSEAFLTPGTQNKCIGCHFLSRDGQRMSFGTDDADSDDEYGDLNSFVMDVGSRMIFGSSMPAGFQAFNPDHSQILASDGVGSRNPPSFFRYDGNAGGFNPPTLDFPSFSGKRVTQPDWSKDARTIYFTLPNAIIPWCSYQQGPGCSNPSHHDDDHFSGGSIYKVDFNPGTGAFGTPTSVVASASGDENNYYPAVSPDGQFLVFNRAVGSSMPEHDAFSNPKARLWALKLNGGAPVDMTRANQGDGLSNSWPRWSPFIQKYKGRSLLWVTFSSTRDYGLRVRNENVPAQNGGPLVNCYPPDSPENPCPQKGVNCHSDPFTNTNCTQPQIWMAAVSLSDLELASGDPSFVAFWLPFQEELAHNHIAQWTEAVVRPPGDGGACGTMGQSCQMNSDCCAGYVCDPQSHTCQFNIP